ncbi:MAG TPA: DUF58 domain-containing protein [Actinomycetota bacterium]|nr:DUF58 domain-containing protein [Actinomycetota bacterium]
MRVRPTRLAFLLVLGAVILFGAGTNVQAGWVLVVAALLLGFVLAGLALPFLALRGLEVVRQAPVRAQAGQGVRATLVVRNRSRGIRGLVKVDDDFLGPATAVAGVLRPGQATAFEAVRTQARRGVHEGGTCTLRSGAPFGMAVAVRRVFVASPVIVHPRVFGVRLQDVMGSAASSLRAASGDTVSVREYRSGDPLRHVHWRSTARRGELVVREMEEPALSDLTIVCDAPADPDALDTAASVACSYAVEAIARGHSVEVRYARDGSPSGLKGAGPEAVLDWGARLRPDSTPVHRLIPDTGSAVCVLSARPGADAAVSKLSRLASGGSGVLAVVVRQQDPSPADVALAGSLTAAGCRVLSVPGTGDLTSWLRGSGV